VRKTKRGTIGTVPFEMRGIVVVCLCVTGTNGLKYTLSDKGIPHQTGQSSSLYPFDALAQLSSSRDLVALNEILPSPRTMPELLSNASMCFNVQKRPETVRKILELTETPVSILPSLCSFFVLYNSLVFVLEDTEASLINGRNSRNPRMTILNVISLALSLFNVPRITIVLPVHGLKASWDLYWADESTARTARTAMESIVQWPLEKKPAHPSQELTLDNILPRMLTAENTSVYYFGTSKPLDTILLVDRLSRGVYPAYLTFVSPVSRNQDSWMSLVMYVHLHTDLLGKRIENRSFLRI
jgi:hypothetical protein